MILWRYIKFLSFYLIRHVNSFIFYFGRSPSREVIRFIPDIWCCFNAAGLVTQHSPHFKDFFKITISSGRILSIWNVLEDLFQEDQIFLLKEKFEKFFSQKEYSYLSETVYKQEEEKVGYLVRLWEIEKNKYLMWIQRVEKPLNASASSDFSPATYRKKLSETLAEFPLILWHHTEKQSLDYCNDTYAEMLGKDVETVLQRKENLFPSNQVANLFQKVKKTGKLQKLRLSKTIEGERHVFDLWEKSDPEGGTWGLSIDISEYEKSKENAKQELKAIEKIFNYLPVNVCIFSKNQKLIYFSNSFPNLFFLDEKWLSQTPSFEEIFDELRNKRLLPEVVDFTSYKKRFLSFFEEEVHHREEVLHLPDERSLRLTVVPYMLGGVVMLFEDITQQLILERKNNTLVAVQSALVNHLQENVWIFSVDHCLTLVNTSCAQLWNLDPSLYKGAYLTQLLNKAKPFFECKINWTLFKSTILSGIAERLPQQGTIHRKDGISLKFRYIPLPSGEHLITYQDITDTFKFQEIFEEASRLLEVTRFVKYNLLESIACELKDWTEQFAKFSTALGKKVTTFNRLQKQSIFDLISISENLKKNLHNILEVIDTPSLKQKIFFKSLIESTLLLFQGIIEEKNIRISKDIQEIAAASIPDKKILSHLVHNLIGYALQGCPVGDHFFISLYIFQNNLRLSLSCRLENASEEAASYRNSAFSLPLIKRLAILCGGDLKILTRNRKRFRLFCDFLLVEEAASPMKENLEGNDLGDARQTACG